MQGKLPEVTEGVRTRSESGLGYTKPLVMTNPESLLATPIPAQLSSFCLPSLRLACCQTFHMGSVLHLEHCTSFF